MSVYFHVKDKDIEIDSDSVTLLIGYDHHGGMYVELTFEQVREMYRKMIEQLLSRIPSDKQEERR